MPTTTTATARHQQSKNVSQPERLASVIGGGTLLPYGLQKRSLAGAGLAAIGGALLYRGVTGHCNMYQTLGLSTASRRGRASIPYELGVRVDHSLTIAKSPEEVYGFWRNLENLPRFMQHLESVQEIDNKHSHWVAKGPAGRLVEWKAEIINETPNHLLAWRSLEGSDVDNAGSVHFRPVEDGAATEVKVALQYNPPGGFVGAFIAKMFGEEPSLQIAEDLGHLKQLIETGEATRVLRPKKSNLSAKGWNRDAVGQASEESFPASDPPSWTPEALAH